MSQLFDLCLTNITHCLPFISFVLHSVTILSINVLSFAPQMGCFGGNASKNDAEEDKRRKEANKRIEKQIQKDKQISRATHRLLLLGIHCDHSCSCDTILN